MASLTKRATIYFDPAIHRVLKMKSAETEHSISEIIDKALRHELAEDQEDLAVFSKSGHFSMTCMASPYLRSRETVVPLRSAKFENPSFEDAAV